MAQQDVILTPENNHLITKTLDIIANYIHQSVENQREILGEEFNSIISNLEYLKDVELVEDSSIQPLSIAEIANIVESDNQIDNISEILSQMQEFMNSCFNSCFEIIDGIVPEEESQDTVILREEVAKIYDKIKDYELFEIKRALQNVLTKINIRY